MARQDGERKSITPEQGWETIQKTLDTSRSSMYLAGWTTIMLLWGTLYAIGYLSQYAVATLAPSFADTYPWYPGPLWAGVGLVGMIGSAIIGSRASKRNAQGPTSTGVGLRVFFFWISVVLAAFIIPPASGMWTNNPDGAAIGGVVIGIIALGYVLFGVMNHAAISLVGLGFAASYYIPSYIFGDIAPLVSANLMLVFVAVAWLWLRRSDAA